MRRRPVAGEYELAKRYVEELRAALGRAVRGGGGPAASARTGPR